MRRNFMTRKDTKGTRIVPWFALGALLEFLVYYLVSILINDFDIVYYYLYFVERFLLLCVPVAAAAVIVRREKTWSGAIKASTYISLTRLIVFIPFFYIEFVYGIYDSLEAILLSLLASTAAVIIYVIVTLLAFALMRYIIKRRGGATYPTPVLDVGKPATFSVFAVSLIIFVINLIFEIYSTVIFIIENGTIYYVDEILLVVFSYVFLAILLIGIHAVGVIALNRGAKKE